MTFPRIPPLAPPYSEPVTAALERIMPAGVPPLALFRTLAVNERVFLRLMAGGLLDRGSMTLRERELVIDRTCSRCGAEYEWGVHVAFFAEKATLTPGEVAGTCAPDPAGDAVLRARAATPAPGRRAPRHGAGLGRALEALDAEWTAEQLIELIALAGFYHMISFMANGLRIPAESYAARFPACIGGAGRAGGAAGRGIVWRAPRP